MATWKCGKCGKEVEGRCRPKECPQCKAGKESFSKKE